MRLVDPSVVLPSLQKALDKRQIRTQPGRFDPTITVAVDEPQPGDIRTTYIKRWGKQIVSYAITSIEQRLEGLPVFGIGYSTAPNFRGQGKAKDVVNAAIAEMRHGYAGYFPEFWVEAIVSIENIASQKVAEATISIEGIPGTDSNSGEPILQYLRKITTGKNTTGAL